MSLASALFSDSQARLFVWLFAQPERDFHLSELRRLSALGSASLQRELRRLASARLITSERQGNQRRFRANPESPVYAELVALSRKVLGAEPLVRQALQPLPGLRAAWIYGSVASGRDHAQSDIDLMLVGEGLSLSDVLALLLPLETQLGRRVNPTCYTPADFKRRRAEPDSFLNRVLAQPRIDLIGNARELD